MSSSSSSSSNSKAVLKVKRGGGLQGPRPQPLSLRTASARPSKKPRVSGGDVDVVGGPGPVIIYECTPKAVHVRPDEFMAVVQRLTGQQHPPGHLQAVLPRTGMVAPVMSSPAEKEELATAPTNHLFLAFGQQEAPPLGNLLMPVLPSPGPAPDDFLLSPGIFLFSPATMQAIHELIS